ncbi:MAG: acyl-CoA dehydrogenase family protein, partial [Alphaproteobacteria bacterium]|nr:acyl-CoA dehydrogenase family protein [Alphaproteobacteria bacterium]
MTADLCRAVEAFFDSEILPRHRDWVEHVVRRREPAPFLAGLQARAKELGLWNLAVPGRLTNLDFAPLAEVMGRLPWAPEVFNCQAPDVPNMVMLAHAATQEQKARWLNPLLEGRIRSAFAMTEPDVASSDATKIATSLRREGEHWVVNGRKWYIT